MHEPVETLRVSNYADAKSPFLGLLAIFFGRLSHYDGLTAWPKGNNNCKSLDVLDNKVVLTEVELIHSVTNKEITIGRR